MGIVWRAVLEGVELVEIGFHAWIRGVDLLRGHERGARFCAGFWVLRERRGQVDPRALRLVVEAKRLAVFRDSLGAAPDELVGVAEVREVGGARRVELHGPFELR